MSIYAAWKANEKLAQGNALGGVIDSESALKEQKNSLLMLLLFQSEICLCSFSQGVALGYKLSALSGRGLAPIIRTSMDDL